MLKRKNRLGCLALGVWGFVVLLVFGLGTMAFTGYLDVQTLAVGNPIPTLVPTLSAASIQQTLAPLASPTPAGIQLPPTWTPAPSLTNTPTPTVSSTPPSPSPTATPLPTLTPTFIFTPKAFSEGPIVIGYTYNNNPIEVYRFGTGPVERMLVAGINGGYEWNTVALADELIAYIQENPDFIPPTVTLYIVRNLNPDGLLRSKGVNGRTNARGVDLNRNFPVNWVKEWSRATCWGYVPTTGGDSPGSERETQALINFVTTQTRVTAIISYHSAALGIFPGGEPPHAASVSLADTLATVSDYPYPAIDIGCVYTGTLPDWAASIGIASVDLELANHTDTDFDVNLRVVTAFMKWRKNP